MFCMVVYLAINGEDVFSIIADDRLSAGVWGRKHKINQTNLKDEYEGVCTYLHQRWPDVHERGSTSGQHSSLTNPVHGA